MAMSLAFEVCSELLFSLCVCARACPRNVHIASTHCMDTGVCIVSVSVSVSVFCVCWPVCRPGISSLRLVCAQADFKLHPCFCHRSDLLLTCACTIDRTLLDSYILFTKIIHAEEPCASNITDLVGVHTCLSCPVPHNLGSFVPSRLTGYSV